MFTGTAMGEHDSGSQHDFRAACTMQGKCFSPAYLGWVYGCPEPPKEQAGLGASKTDPWQWLQSARALSLQVLRYFDYVFTGVFTFEMVIKVRAFAGWLLQGCRIPQHPCSGWETSQFFGSGPKFGDFKVWFLAVGVENAQRRFYLSPGS